MDLKDFQTYIWRATKYYVGALRLEKGPLQCSISLIFPDRWGHRGIRALSTLLNILSQHKHPLWKHLLFTILIIYLFWSKIQVGASPGKCTLQVFQKPRGQALIWILAKLLNIDKTRVSSKKFCFWWLKITKKIPLRIISKSELSPRIENSKVHKAKLWVTPHPKKWPCELTIARGKMEMGKPKVHKADLWFNTPSKKRAVWTKNCHRNARNIDNIFIRNRQL